VVVPPLPRSLSTKSAVLVSMGLPAQAGCIPACGGVFRVGQRVRADAICNPVGYMTPAAALARETASGTVDRDHGVSYSRTRNAHFLGEKPQHVYSVRFDARELWESRQVGATPSMLICGTITLSQPDSVSSAEASGGSAAHFLALAVQTVGARLFTWKEWASTLADELKAAAVAR